MQSQQKSRQRKQGSLLERQRGVRSLFLPRSSSSTGIPFSVADRSVSDYSTPKISPRQNETQNSSVKQSSAESQTNGFPIAAFPHTAESKGPPWPLPPRSSTFSNIWSSKGSLLSDLSDINMSTEACNVSNTASTWKSPPETFIANSPRQIIHTRTISSINVDSAASGNVTTKVVEGETVILRSSVSEHTIRSNTWSADCSFRCRSESLNFESGVEISNKNEISPMELSPSSNTQNDLSRSFKLTPKALNLLLVLRSYRRADLPFHKESQKFSDRSLLPPKLKTSTDECSDCESKNRRKNKSYSSRSFAKFESRSRGICQDIAAIRARSSSPNLKRNVDKNFYSPLSLGGQRESVTKRQKSALSGLIEVEMLERLSTMNVVKVRKTAIQKFNINAKEGINFLISEGGALETPEGVAEFLFTESGLSKRKKGEYFGRNSSFNQKVFEQYLGHLDFAGLTLDEALRRMVTQFRMPGEAQQIDRIMEHFAKLTDEIFQRWYTDNNGGGYSCVDTAYILSFSLMMLNTDLYNRNLKESEKMSLDQFCLNNRGIDQGRDLPRSLLEGMYNRIKENEIRMDEVDMFESEVITFNAPRLCGWLKKKSKRVFNGWKRHWFVLVNGVLYYFFAPQDTTPRCIIPLERVIVQVIGPTDLVVTATQGYVKSVKVLEDGGMLQGSHKEFILRADKKEERDKWVKMLRSETQNPFIDQSLPATPNTVTPKRSFVRTKDFTSFESELSKEIVPPRIRGWARTQNESGGTWSRRYCAIFKEVDRIDPVNFIDVVTSSSFIVQSTKFEEDEVASSLASSPDTMQCSSRKKSKQNILYFYGTSEMCDRMVTQKLHTSHGAINLSDVTVIEIRTIVGSGVQRKGIIMYTYGCQETVKDPQALHESTSIYGARRWVIVPEECFHDWVKVLLECCGKCSTPIVKDDPIQIDTDDLTFGWSSTPSKSPTNMPPSPTWSRQSSTVSNPLLLLQGNFLRKSSIEHD